MSKARISDFQPSRKAKRRAFRREHQEYMTDSDSEDSIIHLREERNPPRRSERLKHLKPLFHSSVGHCNTSQNATGRSSARTIEVNDSEDSMPLCQVFAKRRTISDDFSEDSIPLCRVFAKRKAVSDDVSEDSMPLSRVFDRRRAVSDDISEDSIPLCRVFTKKRAVSDNDNVYEDCMPLCQVFTKRRPEETSRMADSDSEDETRPIHLPEEPNPTRRSERLKCLKRLVGSSNAHAPGSRSVRTIEVIDSDDSMDSGKSYSSERPRLNASMFFIYMEHIWNRCSETKRDSFAHIDCLWFGLCAEDQMKERVLSWIKREKIFSKKYVLVPIVIWSHWNLLIFCNFGESLESRRKAPCMLLLDSLRALDPLRLEPLIRRFVVDIFRMENRPEKKELIRKIPLMIPKVPQQIDDKKCGYFVLYYINLFIKEAPEEFSMHEGYPYFMKKDWFTLEELDDFCISLDSVDLDDSD